MNDLPVAPLATGWRRCVYVGLGCLFVGLGYLGVVLPGLPATPFLLVASFFFVRSSPRLHRWLRHSPVFGRLLRDWEKHRGIRRPVKIGAVCLIVTVVTCSILFSGLPVWLKWIIAGLALIGVTTILMLPTARDPARIASEIAPLHSDPLPAAGGETDQEQHAARHQVGEHGEPRAE